MKFWQRVCYLDLYDLQLVNGVSVVKQYLMASRKKTLLCQDKKIVLSRCLKHLTALFFIDGVERDREQTGFLAALFGS